MSETETSGYGWYVENDDSGRYLCIVDSNESNYTGTAKVFYSKTEDTDTNVDLNEPTIPGRYHWALVWGVLYLMGFTKYYENYRLLTNEAKKSAAGVLNGTIRNYDY